MNMIDLKQLYDATAEDLRFGVGLLDVPGRGHVPFIQIHQPGWSSEMLEIVRDSFRDGLTLTEVVNASGTVDLCLASRQRIAIQAKDRGQTGVLRAAAWDARLSNVDPVISRRFLSDWARLGGFLLLLQSPEWEFVVAVHREGTRADSSPISPRTLPIPAQA